VPAYRGQPRKSVSIVRVKTTWNEFQFPAYALHKPEAPGVIPVFLRKVRAHVSDFVMSQRWDEMDHANGYSLGLRGRVLQYDPPERLISPSKPVTRDKGEDERWLRGSTDPKR
jgi:hypothetical protein